MEKKSVAGNAILNAIRNSIFVIYPLITYPYVTRVLGVENLGKVTYSQSIEGYFALVAALGITTYAVREGALVREDKKKLQSLVSELFTTNMITTIIAYVLLFLVLFLVPQFKDYRSLILLLSIAIIFTTVGVDWINNVFEDFYYITIRSIVIQIAVIALLFIFVKDENDYYIYAFLTILSTCLISASNFFHVRKYCKLRITRKPKFISHVKEMLIFFANNLAIQIFVNVDMTMLGLYTSDFYTGIYAVAVKIYNVIKVMVAAVFTVCIPRLTSYWNSDKKDMYKTLLQSVTDVCTLLVFPAVVGLICLARPIVLIISGQEFEQSITSLSILSIAIIGSIYSGVLTNCINLPMKREINTLKGTSLAAVVNLILNIGIIPQFKEVGAAVTTIVAEFTVAIFVLFTSLSIIKQLFNAKQLLKNVLESVIGSVFVAITCVTVCNFVGNMFLQVVLSFLLSVIIYAIWLLIGRNEYALYGIRVLKSKLIKRGK